MPSAPSIKYTPIGFIHTPFRQQEGMPIQPSGADGIQGTIEIDPQYVPGLKDLEGFSHIILIYHLHQSKGYDLLVTPFLDQAEHGVFATRAPRRPNAIGLSTVRLIQVKENVLVVEQVDMLDGTPLLDIKPAVPEFEPDTERRLGWLGHSAKEVQTTRSDTRFSSGKITE